MARRAVYSIAPGARFLDTLARAVLDGAILPDWPRQGPFWLSDITIFLPTRRAREALAASFAAAFGLDPMALPDMRALGGEDAHAEPFIPPYAADPPPRAIGRLRRRMLLAQLTEKWLQGQSQAPFSAPALGGYRGRPNAGEVLALADSLGTLIDDFAIAGIDPAVLAAIDDAQLADQRRKALGFVSFVLDLWPGVLAEEGAVDAADRTNRMLVRQAEALPVLHKDKPVIVAGSTGSMPATAQLIEAIASLPRGAVVLPGVDTGLDETRFAALLEETGAPHGHPQYGLARLLRRLGTPPRTVIELAEPDHPRTRILNTALALAGDTADWGRERAGLEPALGPACRNLSLIVARTPELEARAIAMAVRHGLGAGRSVAVIAPDQTLARRITAELDRFGVTLDDAAGTPLSRAPMGRLVRQIVSLLAGGFGPVDLIALLRGPHLRLGRDRGAIARAAEALDLGVLRGQRPAPGLEGLRAGARANAAKITPYPARRLTAEDLEAVLEVIDALEAALSPMIALFGRPGFSAAEFARALSDTLDAVIAAPPEAREPVPDGFAEMTGWIEAALELGARGPRLDRTSLPQALDGLFAGESVRPPRREGADAALYGRLEARLMAADLTILAGLTEGIWPEAADPGPWMSRGMRMAAGLEPPERQHGLAAHDFLMAAGQGEVILSRAERSGTAPATPSRLLQRLEAFLGADLTASLRTRGEIWIAAAHALDVADTPLAPAVRPAPRPPAEMRPRALSVTDAETLLRSPYDLYAKYTLGLRAIAPLGADPDAAERGSIVHDVFGDFISGGNDPTAADAHEVLMEIARARFSGLEAIPERRDIWLRRFAHAAAMFLQFERNRDERVLARHAEISGTVTLPLQGGAITLRGRADRIDILVTGALEIIDFKTGTIPEPAEMKAFLTPQLPLEAVMARRDGFGAELNRPAGALTYIKIANGPEAFKPRAFKPADGMALAEAIDTTSRHFQAHAEALLLGDALPMAARVFPRKTQRYKGDYEHLARTGEWSVADLAEDEI